MHAGVPVALSTLWKVLFSLFRLVSGSPSPLDAANPSFNANDCHLESNASLIVAHCLINVKCCVKKIHCLPVIVVFDRVKCSP